MKPFTRNQTQILTKQAWYMLNLSIGNSLGKFDNIVNNCTQLIKINNNILKLLKMTNADNSKMVGKIEAEMDDLENLIYIVCTLKSDLKDKNKLIPIKDALKPYMYEEKEQ